MLFSATILFKSILIHITFKRFNPSIDHHISLQVTTSCKADSTYTTFKCFYLLRVSSRVFNLSPRDNPVPHKLHLKGVFTSVCHHVCFQVTTLYKSRPTQTAFKGLFISVSHHVCFQGTTGIKSRPTTTAFKGLLTSVSSCVFSSYNFL